MRKSKIRSQTVSTLFLLMLACSFGYAADVHAQTARQGDDEPLFSIWDERGKEGFMNASGNTVIAPQFDKVTLFNEGMAAVRVGDKWGYIDRNGKMIIAPRWKEVQSFSDGVAAVVDGQAGYAYTPLPEEGDGFEISVLACGYIDKTGRYVIAPSLERKLTVCTDFAEGLAPVNFDSLLKFFFPDFSNAGKGGYMDKTGHWAIKPQFEGVSAFSEGLGLVRLRSFREREFNLALNDFAYVDKSGKTVFELKNYFDAAPFHEGLARVTRRPGKVAFVERTGSVLFELESDNVVDFSGGRAAVLDTKTKTYGYIDRSGKWVIPPKYAAAHPFADGLAIVCSYPDTCVYINPQGTVISGDAEDKYINGLSLQYLHTRTIGPTASFRNIYGYRDKSGKYVWVSPGGEIFFGKKWWRENYKGPHMPTTFSRP